MVVSSDSDEEFKDFKVVSNPGRFFYIFICDGHCTYCIYCNVIRASNFARALSAHQQMRSIQLYTYMYVCMYVFYWYSSAELPFPFIEFMYLWFQQMKCEVKKARRMVYSNTVFPK